MDKNLEMTIGQFSFIVAKSAKDLYDEGIAMCNALSCNDGKAYWNHIQAQANPAFIIFMKMNGESFVDIAVENSEVTLVCCSENRRIPGAAADIIEKWAEEKGISFDRKTVQYGVDEESDWHFDADSIACIL